MRSGSRGLGLALMLSAVLGAGCSVFSPPLLSPTPVDAAPFAPVVARYAGSVGKLLSTSCNGAPIAGSGFVIDSRFVLTAAHVVGGARLVSVRLTGGAPVVAEVVGLDAGRDTALVRTASALAVPPLTLAGESTNPGTGVVALGYPMGGEGLRTDVARITSVTDSTILNGHTLHDLVTLDATLQPGTSGGPLVDSAGIARGMVVAQTAGSGGRDSTPLVTLAVPPSSLSGSVADWRDDEPVVPASCAGDETRPSAALELDLVPTDEQAAEFGHTLWLLARSVNGGQFGAAWGMFTPAEQARRGSLADLSAALRATRWTAIGVVSAARDGDRASARVRVRTTSDAKGCGVQPFDYGFRLVQGVWLIDSVTPAGAASSC